MYTRWWGRSVSWRDGCGVVDEKTAASGEWYARGENFRGMILEGSREGCRVVRPGVCVWPLRVAARRRTGQPALHARPASARPRKGTPPPRSIQPAGDRDAPSYPEKPTPDVRYSDNRLRTDNTLAAHSDRRQRAPVVIVVGVLIGVVVAVLSLDSRPVRGTRYFTAAVASNRYYTASTPAVYCMLLCMVSMNNFLTFVFQTAFYFLNLIFFFFTLI